MSNDIGAPPPSYLRVPHWKRFAKESAPAFTVVAFGVFLMIAGAVVTTTTGVPGIGVGAVVVVGLMIALAGAFLVYRRHWQWRNSPIEGNAETGQIRIHHAESRWLFLRGSAPDQYELNEFSLVTPGKTWWELYVFHNSQLVHLERAGDEKPVKLPDVVNVEELLAIDAYWSSLAKADISQLEVQQDIRAELKTNNELLRQVVGILLTIAPTGDIPEKEPPTQELPAVNDDQEPNS